MIGSKAFTLMVLLSMTACGGSGGSRDAAGSGGSDTAPGTGGSDAATGSGGVSGAGGSAGAGGAGGVGGTAGAVDAGDPDAATMDGGPPENCPEALRQQVATQIATIVQKPAYDGCSETGVARPASSECRYVSYSSSLATQLRLLGYCLWGAVRSDIDEAALLAEARGVAGDLYCPKHPCAAVEMTYPCLRPSGNSSSVPWCGSQSLPTNCSTQMVCSCENGDQVHPSKQCNGVADCADGSDEKGCCKDVAGFSPGSGCSTSGDTCLDTAVTMARRCTCTNLVWKCL